MITLTVKDCNSFSQDYYDSMIASLQFHQLTCSCGHSGCLTIHAYYKRKVRTQGALMRIMSNTSSGHIYATGSSGSSQQGYHCIRQVSCLQGALRFILPSSCRSERHQIHFLSYPLYQIRFPIPILFPLYESIRTVLVDSIYRKKRPTTRLVFQLS